MNTVDDVQPQYITRNDLSDRYEQNHRAAKTKVALQTEQQQIMVDGIDLQPSNQEDTGLTLVLHQQRVADRCTPS